MVGFFLMVVILLHRPDICDIGSGLLNGAGVEIFSLSCLCSGDITGTTTKNLRFLIFVLSWGFDDEVS